jgi:uncharacterized Zn finger protein
MTVHCVVCAQEIDNKRVRRGCVTCSPEHQREYQNEKRRMRKFSHAGKRCKSCGRVIPIKIPFIAQAESAGAAVVAE